ncbi:hypothetical protein FACS1894110_23330 [Spirochaetia bacterium]|nr:hypothetical protein FACS1894110_23330 [Spirochaetia bacterium]
MAYQINPGWTYKIIDSKEGFVIDPSGASSAVDLRAINVLVAINAGHSTMAAITEYMRSRGVTISSFSSAGEDTFSAVDLEQARNEEVLEYLLEIGVVSQCA